MWGEEPSNSGSLFFSSRRRNTRFDWDWSSGVCSSDLKAGPRGSVPPPVHVWLKSPGLADHAHQLGAYVRFGTPFSQKLTEIAILMTARYWTAQFEWRSEEGRGRAKV